MPHQCLSCGFTFDEGSSALLQGCPECKGTKFFYTQSAVGDEERKAIAKGAQKDIRQTVTDLLADASPEVADEIRAKADDDGWAQLRPRDLRRLVKKVQAERKPGKETADGVEFEDAVPAQPLAESKARVEQELASQDEDARPDTVTVGDGEYEIDVRGLLEKDPVVVQKDGAYMIHLPSLFQDD